MKPDGVTMETTEPTEAVAAGEPASSQELQPQSQELSEAEAAGADAPEVNGRPVAEVKPKTVDSKAPHKGRPAGGAAMSSQRPGTSSSRVANNSASQNATAAAAGRRVAAAKAPGAVPKRPAAASTARNPSREPPKTPARPTRTASAAPATATSNGARPAAPSSSVQKRTAPETVNGARPKTTLSASRSTASATSKPTASTTTKAGAAAAKTTRPTAVPPAVRPHFTTSRPTSTTRPPPAGAKSSSTASSAKAAASRGTTAPPAGRPAVAQLPKSAAPAAKKDVSRPPSTTAARKPTTATVSATKKPEPSKSAAPLKLGSASKQPTTVAVDTKVSQLRHQQPNKSPATKKTVGEARSTAANNSSTVRTPPVSPATRPGVSNLVKSKYGKPTQNVSPFTVNKKTEVLKTKTSGTGAQAAPGTRRPAGPKTVDVAAAVAEVEPQAEFHIASVPVEVPTSDPTVQAAPAPQEVPPNQEVVSLPQPSPISTAPPVEQPENSCSLQLVQEEAPAPSQPASPPVAHSPASPKGTNNFSAEQSPSESVALPLTASDISLMVPSTNLNEEEDEEEREGSQLVSVSEMSGTTQPTEESRPGSAGLAAGSAWRASGALLSELDSEEVSGSQQGGSELSAPGVLEGTESMDDLGDGSLKGAIDMEGASAGSPDFEKVPDIPVNDFDEDEDDDDSDRVCDMDVGSERTDELPRPRHDNDVDDEDDDDVEMASEGVTESGLESYGNADEDDFAEDERLDNLNRMAQPPPPPVLPSAPAAQWDQPNPFADPWAELLQPEQAAAVSPLADAWQLDSETPTQAPVQAWLELGSDPSLRGNPEGPDYFSVKDEQKNSEAQMYAELSGPAREQNLMPGLLTAPGMSQASTQSSETSTPEELGDCNREGRLQATPPSPQPNLHHQEPGVHTGKSEVDPEAPSVSADEVFGGTSAAPTSNPSSSSVTEDEASDTEGEAQLEEFLEPPVVCNLTFDCSAPAQHCLSTVEEGDEVGVGSNGAPAEDSTPPSATSMASYGFDTTTSNAQSTGESCIKSPGIFSLEELPEEAKEPEQQYIKFGKEDVETAAHVGEEALESEEGPDLPPAQSTLPQREENTDDVQPPYYSGICEKTEDSLAGLTALPLPNRRDQAACPRAYCDIVKQHAAAVPPKLTCADLPPRSLAQQALSPQLRRLEQHQRQLQEMQQRRAQQSRPLEEAEQERKRREEEEQRRKKEEAEEEIKRNKEEEERRRREEEQEQRKDLELKLQQQQEELKQRQQIMQWQQELLQTQGQAAILSPSSGLCTIYEALENSDEEEAEGEVDGLNELKHSRKKRESKRSAHQPQVAESATTTSAGDQTPSSSGPPPHPESPDRPPPLDLDWGKKVDIVQQLINQTLLLNGDGCSSLLLLPGGAGGTLSPLESSLWPSLLPPLTPPSATVTSVSSFSPEATGSSPQGEWTVVELETHH